MAAILCVLILGLAAPASAQARSLVDLEAGAGYALGGGAEEKPPGLGTIPAGGTVWPTRGRWGVMLIRVASYGESLRDPPVVSGDVTFLGQLNLRYWRLGARYRLALGRRTSLTAGAGLALGGWYDRRVRLTRPGSTTEHRDRISGGGFAGELFVDRSLSPRVQVRVGATVDGSLETMIVQPVAAAVVSLW